ncbi:MAG: hypothetical protein R2862_12930 [Thermoanaerobaculia bacterium]
MAESLNDANVAVYTFDLTEPGTKHPFANAMNQIVRHGGRYFSDVFLYERRCSNGSPGAVATTWSRTRRAIR